LKWGAQNWTQYSRWGLTCSDDTNAQSEAAAGSGTEMVHSFSLHQKKVKAARRELQPRLGENLGSSTVPPGSECPATLLPLLCQE